MPTPAVARPAVPARPDPRPLGELLMERDLVTAEQLSEALAVQHLEDERIGESLVRLHHCTEKEVCEALGRQFGLPTFVSLAEKDVDDTVGEAFEITKPTREEEKVIATHECGHALVGALSETLEDEGPSPVERVTFAVSRYSWSEVAARYRDFLLEVVRRANAGR